MRHVDVAVGLIRQGDQVLLVQQQGPDDPHPYWTVPGGMVEPGEWLHQALIREMAEETGLAVLGIGRLLYVTQTQRLDQPLSWHAHVFEVTAWRGELDCETDPEVLDVRFFSLSAALAELERHPARVMSEPMCAYLRGEAAPGAVWMYEMDETVQRLVWRLPWQTDVDAT